MQSGDQSMVLKLEAKDFNCLKLTKRYGLNDLILQIQGRWSCKEASTFPLSNPSKGRIFGDRDGTGRLAA